MAGDHVRRTLGERAEAIEPAQQGARRQVGRLPKVNRDLKRGNCVMRLPIQKVRKLLTLRDEFMCDLACEFLRELLKGGPVADVEVRKQAAQLGIAEGTLKRARSRLRVRIKRQTGGRHWTLDQDREA